MHCCLNVSDSLRPPWTIACQAPWTPWHFPSKNTRVGCHFLLQGIFLTQGSNQHLLHGRWVLHCLSHVGSNAYLTYLYVTYL